MNETHLLVNEGKQPVVRSVLGEYNCYAIKTRVVTRDDSLVSVVEEYARPHLEPGDMLFISEKMVACTEGRAIPLKEIRPSRLARLLSRFVTKSSAGIGLSMPETMQCAIDEVGVPWILLAAVAGMFGKLLRTKGWFYIVAGYRAACIDGPCHNTIPPYNEYVVLAPLDPERTAAQLSERLGVTVLIVDINDIGANILGCNPASLDREAVIELLRQNPLGQSGESTPMGILRPVSDNNDDATSEIDK